MTASCPGCLSSLANNLASLAHGAECVVCDSIHTAWAQVRGRTQAKTQLSPTPVSLTAHSNVLPFWEGGTPHLRPERPV